MTRITIDIPAGLNTNDTTLAASPAWIAANCMRFVDGRPQTIGGFEKLVATALTGVCRSTFHWTDNTNLLNVAHGTHSALQVYQGGALYTITPFGPPSMLGSAPFATVNASPTVTVTHTAHGLASTNTVIISGAVDTNGILAANLNGSRVITVTGANTYTFPAGTNATSTNTGGGTAVRIVPQVTLPAGPIDGAPSSGYGTGSYGGGAYGSPSTDATYLRTWSHAAWGQKLLNCPRGGTIYEWSNVTGTKAIAVANAPVQITYMLVSPQFQAFAIGCNQETDGVFNPRCIRHSATRDNTGWTTGLGANDTSREYILPGGGRLVAGRVIGKNLLIWSDNELFLGTYVGSVAQIWRFDKVGGNCGLIGPNAAIVVNSTVFWISPDRQFHSYTLGGAVSVIPCPVRTVFATENAASQGDKIVASSIAEHSEVRFDYPDTRDGYENSRYVSLKVEGPDVGAWSGGIQARTSMTDAGPSAYPIGTSYAGDIYLHEKGQSADGGVLAWSIKTSDFYLDLNVSTLVRQIRPDISGQVGPVSITLYSRAFPQGDVTTSPTYMVAASQDQLDLKASGALFAIEYSGSSAPAYARLGSTLFDVKPRGRR